jgi:hypothetical protein
MTSSLAEGFDRFQDNASEPMLLPVGTRQTTAGPPSRRAAADGFIHDAVRKVLKRLIFDRPCHIAQHPISPAISPMADFSGI